MFSLMNSRIGKKLISKVITKCINSKLDCDSNIKFKIVDLDAERIDDEKIRFNLNIAIDTKEDEIDKIIDKYL